MTYFIFPLSIESLCNMACVAGGICGRYCSLRKCPGQNNSASYTSPNVRDSRLRNPGHFCLRGSCPARSDGEEFSRRLGKILLVESEILGFGLSPSQRFKGAMARESAAENCLVSGAEESFSFRGGTHFAKRKSNNASSSLCGG